MGPGATARAPIKVNAENARGRLSTATWATIPPPPPPRQTRRSAAERVREGRRVHSEVAQGVAGCVRV